MNRMFSILLMVIFGISNVLTDSSDSRERKNHKESFRSWKEQWVLRHLFQKKNNDGKRYNSKVRPLYLMPNSTSDVSPPVTVVTSLNLKSITSVKEVTMDMKVQFTFQQEWYDHRLRYSDHYLRRYEYISLAKDQLNSTWTPDTFFQNEKHGIKHDLDQPNFFVRVRNDGYIVYNQRLSMTFICIMELQKYPMDTQLCKIEFGSYAYTTADIVYVWHEQPLVMSEAGSVLSNFVIESFTNGTCTSKTTTGEYSCLQVELRLKRVFSFFLVQFYLPSTMLVAVSYVSYWIDWRASAGRVPLAIVTLLTTITQSHAINANLPSVSYTKAVDVWVGACVLFVFGSLLEYAFVNYIGIRENRWLQNKKEIKLNQSIQIKSKKKNYGDDLRQRRVQKYNQADFRSNPYHADFVEFDKNNVYREINSNTVLNMFPALSLYQIEPPEKPNHFDLTVHFEDISSSLDWMKIRARRRMELFRWFNSLGKKSRAERIDYISRVMFPFAFFMFNVVYWIIYW